MTVPFPLNNLPPESQPWARAAESRVSSLEQDRASDSTKWNNLADGLAASLQVVAQQIGQQVWTTKANSTNSSGSAVASANIDFVTINTATVVAPTWANNVILLIPTYTSVWLHSNVSTTFSVGQTYCDSQVIIGSLLQGANPMLCASVAATSDYTDNQVLMATNVWSGAATGGQPIVVQQQARKNLSTNITSCAASGVLDVIAIFTR